MAKNEISAIKLIDEALSNLDENMRLRVLRWAWDKYGKYHKDSSFSKGPLKENISNVLGEGEFKEIPGIAQISEDGDFKLTVRDLKAKNTNDAAIRLAHVVVFAYENLTGEKKVSSRKLIIPILRRWRAYTGNTRNALAKEKGILRYGDKVSLDAHSKRDAENFINEILDDSIKGSWKQRR